MGKLVRFLVVGGIAALLIACDKAAPAPPETSTANMDTTMRGGKEAPPRPSAGN